MTVRINFLPRHYQPPKQMGAKEWAIAVACVAAVLAAGGYYSSVYSGTVSLERQAEADSLQLKTVQAKLVEAEEVKARETRVTLAEQELKSLSGHRWSGVLLTLTDLTPKTMSWISLKTAGNDITLTGTSRGLVDMAQLLGGLITEPSINQVTLKAMSETGIPITVTVKAGDQTGVVEGIKSLQDLGMVRQMEFELVITLMPAEGRQLPHGA
jgi:Tfp pilus assembly protein PilN